MYFRGDSNENDNAEDNLFGDDESEIIRPREIESDDSASESEKNLSFNEENNEEFIKPPELLEEDEDDEEAISANQNKLVASNSSYDCDNHYLGSTKNGIVSINAGKAIESKASPPLSRKHAETHSFQKKKKPAVLSGSDMYAHFDDDTSSNFEGVSFSSDEEFEQKAKYRRKQRTATKLAKGGGNTIEDEKKKRRRRGKEEKDKAQGKKKKEPRLSSNAGSSGKGDSSGKGRRSASRNTSGESGAEGDAPHAVAAGATLLERCIARGLLRGDECVTLRVPEHQTVKACIAEGGKLKCGSELYGSFAEFAAAMGRPPEEALEVELPGGDRLRTLCTAAGDLEAFRLSVDAVREEQRRRGDTAGGAAAHAPGELFSDAQPDVAREQGALVALGFAACDLIGVPLCSECGSGAYDEAALVRAGAAAHGDVPANAKRLLVCCSCGEAFHPFCVGVDVSGFTEEMFGSWQCETCKVCEHCHEAGLESTLIICETCFKAYHIGCLVPALPAIPDGEWFCDACFVCPRCHRRVSEDAPGATCGEVTRALELVVNEYCLAAERRCRRAAGTAAWEPGEIDPLLVNYMKTPTLCGDCRLLALFATPTVVKCRGGRAPDAEGESTPCLAECIVAGLRSGAIHWPKHLALERVCTEGSDEVVRVFFSPSGTVEHTSEFGAAMQRLRFLSPPVLRSANRELVESTVLVASTPLEHYAVPQIALTSQSAAVVGGVRVATSLPLSPELSLLRRLVPPKEELQRVLRRVLGDVSEKTLNTMEKTSENTLNGLKNTSENISNNTMEKTSENTLGSLIKHPANNTSGDPFSGIRPATDPRCCLLCQQRGDLPLEGRLLPLGVDMWAHSQCLLRGRVLTDGTGFVLDPSDVEERVRRGAPEGRVWADRCDGHKPFHELLRQRCLLCGKSGAPLSCFAHEREWVASCGKTTMFCAHLGCAAAAPPPSATKFVFDQTLGVCACAAHGRQLGFVKRVLPRYADASQLVVYDAFRHGVFDAEKGAGLDLHLPVALGSLVVLSLGRVCADSLLCPGVGFTSVKRFWDFETGTALCLYLNEVYLGAAGRRVFRVTRLRAPFLAVESASPGDAWRRVVELVNARREAAGVPLVDPSLRGEFFGVTHDWVRLACAAYLDACGAARQQRPRAHPPCRCSRALPVTELHHLPLRYADTVLAGLGVGRRQTRRTEDGEGGEKRKHTAAEGNAGEEGSAEHTMRLLLKTRPRLFDYVTVRRSGIQGFGVFAKRRIKKDTPLMIYTGEVIRPKVADLRQCVYQRKGLSDYMFTVDATSIVDATRIGGVARFVNHSCSPNSRTDIETYNGQKVVVISTTTDIKAGEEITYDYKFTEEETNKIPCYCGSKNCRGTMN